MHIYFTWSFRCITINNLHYRYLWKSKFLELSYPFSSANSTLYEIVHEDLCSSARYNQRILISTNSSDHDPDCSHEDDKIEPDGPVPHIMCIKPYTFFITEVGSSTDLPETRQTWEQMDVVIEIIAIFLILLLNDRPWTHKAHLIFKDVP